MNLTRLCKMKLEGYVTDKNNAPSVVDGSSGILHIKK